MSWPDSACSKSSTQTEPLNAILSYPSPRLETFLEGFPGMSGEEFIALFCRANGCAPDAPVNRIAFAYVD